MNKRWEINRVSTSERIFRKITQEMLQPVGIILFGADGDLKNDVSGECKRRIPGLVAGYNDQSDTRLKRAKTSLSEGHSVLVTMRGETSGDRNRRHQMVTTLRRFGAQSIVGIYAKCNAPTPSAPDGPEDGDTEFARQVAALLQDPQTADGLDYLVTVNDTSR